MAISRILSDGVANTAISRVDGDLTLVGATGNLLWDKSADDLIFPDNAKAVFGAGSDLEIYHNGSGEYSVINQTGAGDLWIAGNDTIALSNSAMNEYYAKFKVNAEVELYYDNSLKFETTSTGVSVTGDVLATDDIYLDSDASVIHFGDDGDVTLTHVADTGLLLNSTREIQFRDSALKIYSSADGQLDLAADTEIELTAATVAVEGIFNVSGTSWLYDDVRLRHDGVVLNFGYDSEVSLTHVHNTGLSLNGNLGIGSTTANALLHLTSGTDQKLILSGSGSPNINLNSSTGDDFLMQNHAGAFRIYNLTDSREDFSIAGDGNATFTGADTKFSWKNDNKVMMYYDASYHMGMHMEADTRDLVLYTKSGDAAGDIRFKAGTGPTERMTILSPGRVGVGISAPTAALHIFAEGTNTTDGAYLLVESTNTGFGGGAVFMGLKHAAAVGANYKPLKIQTASTTILQLNSAGGLGVGEASVNPAHRDPLYHFTHDPNTGMDWISADTLTFRTGGTERLRIASAGQVGIAGANYGSSGQVLTSQGASAAPQWAAAGGGAWVRIGSFSADDDATLDVTGFDVSTYDVHAITWTDVRPMTDDQLAYIRFGDSGGFDSGAYDYDNATFFIRNRDSSVQVSTDTNETGIKLSGEGHGYQTGEGFAATMFFYNGANMVPTVGFNYSQLAHAGREQTLGQMLGARTTAMTVTKIQILFNSGNVRTGNAVLYGLVKS